MTLLARHGAVLREAFETVRSQPIASVVAAVVVAGMCATVFLTTGRTVGAEQAVLSSIDDAGTRSITIRAEPSAGLDAAVIDRIAQISGIEWAGAFSPAIDTQNAAFPGGTKVPLRYVWTQDLAPLGISGSTDAEATAWGSDEAVLRLGLEDGVGGVSSMDGVNFSVRDRLRVPGYLDQLQPALFSPDEDRTGNVAVLVVVADRPDLVAPVSEAVQSVLAVDDPSKVSIVTSEKLATLRALIQGQLGSFGRELVVVIFATSATLVSAILYGLVMMRRKDFGRRRALGASRSLIVRMLLAQVAIIGLVGILFGTGASLIALAVGGDPLPALDFIVAVDILALIVAVIAGVLPAVAAANRDPITELRVP